MHLVEWNLVVWSVAREEIPHGLIKDKGHACVRALPYQSWFNSSPQGGGALLKTDAVDGLDQARVFWRFAWQAASR